MESFKKLGISEPVLKAIAEAGFEKPTVIQEKGIPPVIEGKDVIGGSATGSGKTLVFGAGIIGKCRPGEGIQALILTPTRELAQQIAQEMIRFSKYKPLSIATVYGGVSINPQMDALKVADVVVATPGRTLDHLERRTIQLGRVEILVLDEADRMLDMGFIDDVERIIRACPKKRQTMLFSATIPFEVDRLSRKYMHEPVRVSAEQQVDPSKLKQVYYDIPQNMKFSLLVHLLKSEKRSLVMVFCNSRATTDFVANNLHSAGVDAIAIHGGLTQDKRDRTMNEFHSKDVHVLVCTDVAARGLDIKGVSHAYNYNIPMESKQYIHRIGRTARAGKEGKAINLLSPEDFDDFTAVLRDNNLFIDKEDTPEFIRIPIKWRPPHRSFDDRGSRRGPPRRGFGGAFRGLPRRGSGFGQRSRGPRGRTHRPHRPRQRH